ncbi:hypothetical protein, partial [Neisseria meningitidis]|uniref:hypothetical protein n=1 Tax=Neisseria meningitidis TaxID=487 RepID=UPI001C8F4A38
LRLRRLVPIFVNPLYHVNSAFISRAKPTLFRKLSGCATIYGYCVVIRQIIKPRHSRAGGNPDLSAQKLIG